MSYLVLLPQSNFFFSLIYRVVKKMEASSAKNTMTMEMNAHSGHDVAQWNNERSAWWTVCIERSRFGNEHRQNEWVYCGAFTVTTCVHYFVFIWFASAFNLYFSLWILFFSRKSKLVVLQSLEIFLIQRKRIYSREYLIWTLETNSTQHKSWPYRKLW